MVYGTVRTQRGMTLMEMLIVIVVLLVLELFLFPIFRPYNNQQGNAGVVSLE